MPPAKITNDNGTVSDNVEQKYQENRAEFLDDVGAVAAIKVAKTALACYQAGRKIKATPEKLNAWYTTRAKEDMYQIVLKKCQPNPQIKAFLLATGDTKIIEANANDKRWGVGIGIRSPNITGWKKIGWGQSSRRCGIR